MADAPEPPIYRDLMALKPDGLTPNAWAVKAGVSRTVWADMRKHGEPRRTTVEKLLGVIGITVAEFEARRARVLTEVRGTGMAPQELRDTWSSPGPAVPLVGSAFGGDWDELDGVEMTELHLGEVLDYLGRPQSLTGDPEAYAVEIVGESMAPRFEPGERAFVSPRSPVRVGDDVVVQLNNGTDDAKRVTMVLIKRIERRSATFVELRQFNPAKTFKVPVERIRSIHRVRGRL